jgi:hypothetical protein
MALPGFTAEVSLRQGLNRYKISSTIDQQEGTLYRAAVIPCSLEQDTCYHECMRTCSDPYYYCKHNCHCECYGIPNVTCQYM